ncbi:hypothetical protein [Vibrio vulnificus YJ016]|uniref:Uncharacterized protein n=1 Tax=Vibrio vulnificus (strain YJ016) TaxID=196600 RepID=Q7MFZ5_VIBVY|nr:hypothetical protein [Vibrio vulnificus YJ016]
MNVDQGLVRALFTMISGKQLWPYQFYLHFNIAIDSILLTSPV